MKGAVWNFSENSSFLEGEGVPKCHWYYSMRNLDCVLLHRCWLEGKPHILDYGSIALNTNRPVESWILELAMWCYIYRAGFQLYSFKVYQASHLGLFLKYQCCCISQLVYIILLQSRPVYNMCIVQQFYFRRWWHLYCVHFNILITEHVSSNFYFPSIIGAAQSS